MGFFLMVWQMQLGLLLAILPMVAGIGLGVMISRWLGFL